jgi:hypothetical protein
MVTAVDNVDHGMPRFIADNLPRSADISACETSLLQKISAPDYRSQSRRAAEEVRVQSLTDRQGSTERHLGFRVVGPGARIVFVFGTVAIPIASAISERLANRKCGLS